jgi:thioesterase domain-containing protein
MAAVYLEALLSFQPRGPYLLAGSSLGGVIAFEMARQLLAQGREVAFLGLLDASDPVQFVQDAGEAEGEAEYVILRYVTRGNLPLSREQLRDLAPEERLDALLVVCHASGAFSSAFGRRELGRLVRVVGANRRALRAYAPQPLDASLVYLKAADNPKVDGQEEGNVLWEGLARGGAEVHEVPGQHLSMHFPPHVGALAARLGSAMERALRERVEETDRGA